jgi:ribosomal protein S18 acetylase RimI-like enzyme
MDILINKTSDYKSALDIARKNSHFFNSDGLKTMEMDFKSGILFGAFDGQKIVGFICFKELNGQAIELAWVAVVPEYQREGIGKFLVNECLKLLPKRYLICEVKILSEIDPDPEYAKTRSFYKQLGFIALETISPYKN